MTPKFYKTILLITLWIGSLVHSNAQYCTSNATNTDDTGIDQVVLVGDVTTISQSSAGVCADYTDNTGLAAADLAIGGSYALDVTLGTCGGDYNKEAQAFIDWNQDGDFDDAGENIGSTGFTSSTTILTINFVAGGCGGTALLGNTRLRVVLVEGGVSSPCGTYSWGETEDYTVEVKTGTGPTNDFNIAGDAIETGTGCVQLTADVGSQQGYAWGQNSHLNFGSDFSYDFTVNLGDDNGGADGIAFIIQNDPANICVTGSGGWGAGGIANSLAVEIDTYLNTEDRDDGLPGVGCSTSGVEPDHLDIWLNGDINPSGFCGSSPGARIIPAAVALTDGGSDHEIENGLDHVFRVAWDLGTTTLSAGIWDATGTIHYGTVSHSFDPLVLFGTTTPFYGFSASTGGFSNEQSFCAPADLLLAEITEVKAQVISEEVKFSWVTKSEELGDQFIVERSQDGIYFEELSFIEGVGTAHEYSVWDELPYQGVSYYRLKEIDARGEVYYSELKAVTIANSLEHLGVYPNPVNDLLWLDISDITDIEDLDIKIYNSVARSFEPLVTQKGKHFLLDVQALDAGVYMMQVRFFKDRQWLSQVVKIIKL
ncbi:MAG: hypothetical protein GY810_08050 [Aureispira sp.]|nr:hypothetical protein [Aureispira sp.]